MRKHMRTLSFTVTVLILFVGCTLVETPQFMQDQLDNQYFEKSIYGDPNAYYIGEWTAATGPYLTSMKITENGNVKNCASNEHFGSNNGKIFKEDGKIKMIDESGTQQEIKSLEGDHLAVTVYDQEYKYYRGNVPDRCKAIFSEFK